MSRPAPSPTTRADASNDGDFETWCFSWLDQSGISDEAGTEAAMRAILARVEAEAEVAPSAIPEPMGLHLESTRPFVQAMEDADWNEANILPADQRALAPTPELDQAIADLDAYARENCE